MSEKKVKVLVRPDALSLKSPFSFEHSDYENKRNISEDIMKNQTRSKSMSYSEVKNSPYSQLLTLKTSLSEGSRINECLKSLAGAFSERTQKTVEKIIQPPTPSSEESDTELSNVSDSNFLMRLEAVLPTSLTGSPKITNDFLRVVWRKLLLILSFKYLLDPQGHFLVKFWNGLVYLCWLSVVTCVLIYNSYVIPLRVIFLFQSDENSYLWFIVDSVADIIYALDIILFKTHVRVIRDGFWTQEPKEASLIYLKSQTFLLDLGALFPLDIIFAIWIHNLPWLRLPRLLKIGSFWEFFERLDSALSSPHSARLIKTILYMIYMIHLNASAYYFLSRFEGIGITPWTYDGRGNAYIRCFYFATKTVTSIGKNPKPTNEIEYMFMTAVWLSGVFVFAILIGQIRDIVATATRSQTEYRQVCYTIFNYLHRFEVPSHLQNRVKSWLNYTWNEQKCLDESKILRQLPERMQADLALHVHIETLSKVKLFKNCETAFLRDLVVKLRSVIFLPGDYVCRKGEVGKEMYIIKSGRVEVVGGPNNSKVLATLASGSVFGEIALLAIGGMTKRTADVRSEGFSNLFVLNKGDLNEAIRDYPVAQLSLKREAKKLIRNKIKQERKLADTFEGGNNLKADVECISNWSLENNTNSDDKKIIIKNKPEGSNEPKLIHAVLKVVDPNSMTAKYLKYGSKASWRSENDDDNDSILSSSSGYLEKMNSSYPIGSFLSLLDSSVEVENNRNNNRESDESTNSSTSFIKRGIMRQFSFDISSSSSDSCL